MALEGNFPEVIETQPEILAHHFTEGRLVDKAVGYWLRPAKTRPPGPPILKLSPIYDEGSRRRGICLMAH